MSSISSPHQAMQYMSDLHFERLKYDYEIAKAAPLLLLAGDIGRFCDRDAYEAFLLKQCQRFDAVYLIAGNHEFYGSSRANGLSAVESFVNNPLMKKKLHFLNRTRIDIPNSDFTILGCTLQSHIAPDYTKLTNDFARIEDWRVRDHNAEHEQDKQWLKSSLVSLSSEKPQRQVIVATHYAPSFTKTTHPLNENNSISQCFSSHTLEEMRQWQGGELVKYWIFGHTHWNAKFKYGNTIVLSNQLCNDDKALSWWQRKTKLRAFDPTAILKLP